jgi:hypothetical protein
MADGGERLGEFVQAPAEPGPAFELVNVHYPHLMRRLYPVISASGKVFSARAYLEAWSRDFRKSGNLWFFNRLTSANVLGVKRANADARAHVTSKFLG